MKSEKRHELQTNVLADWIGKHSEGAADYFWPVVGGIVVAFAAAVGIVWYMNTQDASTAQAWDKYYEAFGERERETELKKVAETYAGTAAGLWAHQAVADISLSKGCSLLFTDRGEAMAKLKEAETNYKEVLENARDPFLLTRAQYGMGRLQEALCQPAEAQKYYEKVAKALPDSALGKAAKRDAERMAKPETVAFLAWFAEQKPRKPVPTGHGGLPGFNVPTDLPERPDISLPGGLNIDSVAPPPATDPSKPAFPKPAEPSSEAPKGEAAPASPPAPASTPPGE